MKRFKLIDGKSLLAEHDRPITESCTSPRNWDCCILCQDSTKSEPLQCPIDSKRQDVGAGYKSLADNLMKFAEIDALPNSVNLASLDAGSGMIVTMMTNRAKWHKSCRDLYNSTKLQRAVKRHAKCLECDQNDDHVLTNLTDIDQPHDTSCNSTKLSLSELCTNKPFTRSESIAKPDTVYHCFFCKQIALLEELTEASTFNIDLRVRHCALVLNDSQLIADLSEGDMPAINAKYHLGCLHDLYNRARSIEKQLDEQDSNAEHSDLYALAFAQLIEYICEQQLDSTTAPVFKLSELADLYQCRLQQFGIKLTSRINTTRLKNQLLAQFPNMRAQTCGKQVLLVFDADVGSALSAACQFSDVEDAWHLAKAAEIVRRHLFDMDLKFTGEFKPGCQKSSVPQNLLTLIQMILEGPSVDIQSNATCVPAALSLSQLIVFNAVKHARQQSKLTDKVRHSLEQETPLPLYLSLMLHAETRKRELIDKLFGLGLCVSYDRLLHISTGIVNQVCQSYDTNSGIRPPGLHLGLFTTAAVDNIDHNPSSTSSRDSFHGTGISIVQHRVTESDDSSTKGGPVTEIHIEQSKCISHLPLSYSNVQPLSKQVHILVLNCEKSVSVCDTKQFFEPEYIWLENVKQMIVTDSVCVNLPKMKIFHGLHIMLAASWHLLSQQIILLCYLCFVMLHILLLCYAIL